MSIRAAAAIGPYPRPPSWRRGAKNGSSVHRSASLSFYKYRPLWPRTIVLPRSLSDTSLRLPEIFSNNASDSDSSTVPSVFNLSSESESESKDKFYNSTKRGPRRRYASLRLSSPSGITSDVERIDVVLAIVARDKKLSLKDRPKATIYIEDIAEFARDLKLILVRDLNRGRPRLFIYLRPKFTKLFLSKKESNIFPIPEIIFNPILVLSPYIFLLGILFRIGVFKSLLKDGLIIDCPKNLYRLRILDRLKADSLRIVLEKGLTRIKRGSKITGFAEVAKLYYLRYGVVKAFNDSHPIGLRIRAILKIFPAQESEFETLRSLSIKKRTLDYSRSSAISYRRVALIPEQSISGRRLKRKYIILIDSILTLPGITVEKEYKRRITIINIVIAVYNTEEGTPSRPRAPQKSTPLDKNSNTFSKAIASICVKYLGERLTIYFICLSNTRLLERERLKMYKNPGSLSRHFVNKHIKPFPNNIHYKYNIYGEKLISKSRLLNYT
ncbi:hypothetical protein N7537_003821 [Penicillium hordei]|uniref:Uncharacterized protein n=1 Tax=Penicillium hordei TaxID=40994 RepID=A0AAD6EA87_9EURO|nr:uncharacterized protein N7537_003821 [Penicillium hordei]KAJ5607202.1 hypothetical protein N7537_003821 [Penicillium hordei]